MSLHYSCIARGPTILCSHQEGGGAYEDEAGCMLQRIPTRNNTKATYTGSNNDLLFHCIIENGLIFMCVAEKDVGKTMPYGFLAEIKKRFVSLESRAITGLSFSLQRDFEQVLSQNMTKFSKGQGSGMSAVQQQVDEVKGIMTQNIEKVLERGEKLDDLLDKTEELESSSKMFQTTARRVRKKYWWKNTKMTICLVVVAIVVVIVLTLIILFSTGVLPPDSSSTTTAPLTTTKAP